MLLNLSQTNVTSTAVGQHPTPAYWHMQLPLQLDGAGRCGEKSENPPAGGGEEGLPPHTHERQSALRRGRVHR